MSDPLRAAGRSGGAEDTQGIAGRAGQGRLVVLRLERKGLSEPFPGDRVMPPRANGGEMRLREHEVHVREQLHRGLRLDGEKGRRGDPEPLKGEQQEPVRVEIVRAHRDRAARRHLELCHRPRERAHVPAQPGKGDGPSVMDEGHGVGALRGVKLDVVGGRGHRARDWPCSRRNATSLWMGAGAGYRQEGSP
jgi:hypothetical protein